MPAPGRQSVIHLTVVALLLFAANATAQTAFTGLTIEETIALLESGGETILYSTDLVKPWMRVRAEPDQADNAERVLDEVLAPYDLRARPGPEGTIIIVRGSQSPSLQTGGILGIVKESRTGQRVSGAEVTLDGKPDFATTSNSGHFSFSDLPPGSYVVKINEAEHAWVSTHMAEVEPGKTTVALIDVGSSAVVDLGSVVITASQYRFVRSSLSSHTYLPATELEKLPDIGDDPMRAVHRLPGTAASEYTAKSNIRGGEVDEALVRLDGLRLYNAFHLKDFQSIFSSIDPRLVSGMNVYTGGFPVEYGDRMSGVIDITSLQPADTRRFEISASFFNTSALGTGTFNNGKGEWLASLRRGNLDLIIDKADPNLGKPRYFDAYGRFKYDLTDTLSMSANVLVLQDDLEVADSDREEISDTEYNDEYFWLGLEHSPTPDVRSRWLISHTRLTSERTGISNQPGLSQGVLSDERSFTINTLQTDWSWQLSDRSMLSFGGELRNYDGRYDYMDQVDFDLIFAIAGASSDTTRTRNLSARPDGEQYSAYANLRIEPTSRLVADLGLRWDKQTLTANNEDDLSPRLNLLYWLSDRSRLRASWGQYYQSQGIHELQINDGITTYFAPQRSIHTILGFEHSFDAGIDLRLEVYEKKIDKVRPRYENFLNPIVVLPELKPDRIEIDPESARARGVEVLLTKRDDGPIGWWFGYTWSSVEDRINGMEIRRSWDQKNDISAGVTWDTEKWTMSLAATRHTGWPTTATMLATLTPFPVVATGPRNDLNVDDYRTIDARVERRFLMDNSSLFVFATVANVFGRNNKCCVDYDIEDEGAGLVYDTSVTTYLGVIPSLGFVWEF